FESHAARHSAGDACRQRRARAARPSPSRGGSTAVGRERLLETPDAVGETAGAAAQEPARALLLDRLGEVAAQRRLVRRGAARFAGETPGAVPHESDRLKELAADERSVRTGRVRALDEVRRLFEVFDGPRDARGARLSERRERSV